MKQYTVYFSQPVKYMVDVSKFNLDTRKWSTIKAERESDTVILSSLVEAKKLIKENLDKYLSSCITKIWDDGGRTELGEINIGTYIRPDTRC